MDATLHQTVLYGNTFQELHRLVEGRFNGRMDIQAIRRARLREVIGAGSIVEFAKRVGKSPTQLSDMLGERKSFGEKVARDIEKRARLPTGSLDETEHPAATPATLDTDLLRQAVTEAERRIAARGLTTIITPEDRAEVVLLVYEGLQEGIGLKQVERFVDGTLRAIARGVKA